MREAEEKGKKQDKQEKEARKGGRGDKKRGMNWRRINVK